MTKQIRRATAHTYSSLQNQQTSPLLRLPAELRNKIYEYVFGGEHLLVYTQNKRRLVRQKDPTRPLSRDLPEYPALTAVSRQLNTETKHMVFSHNTFGTFSECLLLSFRSVFQPWQVNCITTLHVTVSDLTIWGWEYTGGWVHSAKKVRDILMMFPGLECLVFELAVPFAGNTRLPASRVWPLWSRLLHYTQRALKDQDGSVRFVATVSRIDWEAAE